MSNVSPDLSQALQRLQAAKAEVAAISKLPSNFGAKLVAPNGVVWTRVGGDAWIPDNGALPATGNTWPSSHIANIYIWSLMQSIKESQ